MVFQLNRRRFLGAGAAAVSCVAAGDALAATRLPLLRPGSQAATPQLRAGASARELDLINTHTDEKLKIVYWANGRYEPEALAGIDRLMRDHRSGDVHAIDPALLDTLHALKRKLGTNEAFHIVSGYRSPVTNAQMHESNAGVAKKSYHMRGMAVDIRVPGRELSYLRNAALDIGTGGVGYYPRSDFIHVDVGPVRQWGMRRA
ncbi:MAG: Twin-arginine translocation pathway signal [Alphaproteobacteria bacterium HGW-Alphaproteobacteria-3]|nr:MAG: Twin-arginine translocation pathway signal [Alphaproteobacteria bacterium HGW-Alphaproteobacteria-3]